MAFAEKPKGLSKWEQIVEQANAFRIFLYNKEKGEVMGRGAKSWGKITIFFIIFYMCLSAFFAGVFHAFLATMPSLAEGPKLTQYLEGTSALRTSPSHKISNFDKDDESTYKTYVSSIVSFLKDYREQDVGDDFANYSCNFTSTEPMPSSQKKQCKFDLTKLGPCYGAANNFTYGYGDGAPCFYLKINKVFDWVPQPNDGLSYIKIECSSGAPVSVYPKETPGFPVSFYPFRGQNKWLAPIVAVQVNGTSDITVKCSAYAKNVKRSETYLLERGAFNRIRITIK